MGGWHDRFQSAPPRRSKGRSEINLADVGPTGFQSAPPAEARGDARLTSDTAWFLLVSIRSPRRSKGRSFSFFLEKNTKKVSIRSPRRSKGRCPGGFCHRLVVDVSIRSPRRSKGRCWRSSSRGRPRRCFNPLPPPKQGEIAPGPPGGAPTSVSIRSPRRSKGRFEIYNSAALVLDVSIRSPRRSKGR